MSNRKFLILSLVILLMPMLLILFPLEVNAAPPLITIEPIKADASDPDPVNVDYCFGWESDGLTNTDNIAIAFEAKADENERFDIAGLTFDEVTFYVGDKACSGGTARVTESGTTDNNAHDQFAMLPYGWIPGYVVAYINLDENTDDDPFVIADDTEISIGFANQAGNSVKTPVTPGNYKVSVEQIVDEIDPVARDWLDTQLLYIGNQNEVDITATLDPSISLAVAGNVCQLGNLTTDKIQTCGYSATVTTNIGTGYIGYIEQNHPFQNTVNGVTTVIDDPGVDNVVNGTDPLLGDYGEYGIGVLTDDTTTFQEFTGTCITYDGGTTSLPASTLPDTNRHAFASYTAPANGVDHGLTYFCSGVRIKYTTPPGVYENLLTITVVGNF